MVPPSFSSAAAAAAAEDRRPSFVKNAIKNKHKFIQCFAMAGIFLLSVRSLGQKYRIHDLVEDLAVLEEEKRSLSNRITHIKNGLYHEASLDSTGLFAKRLRLLFGGGEE